MFTCQVRQLLQSSATTLTTSSVGGISIIDQNGLVQIPGLGGTAYHERGINKRNFPFIIYFGSGFIATVLETVQQLAQTQQKLQQQIKTT
jgi:hypothetical protein